MQPLTNARAHWVTLIGLFLVMLDIAMLAGPPSVAVEPRVYHPLPPGLPALLTFGRLAAGILTGAVAGIAVGIASARLDRFGSMISAILDAIIAVPSLGIICCVVAFAVEEGLSGPMEGDALLIIITAIPPFLACAQATLRTLPDVPKDYVAAGLGLGLTSWQRLWRIGIPWAVPAITRAFLAMLPLCWINVVMGETLIARLSPMNGVGRDIASAQHTGQILPILADGTVILLLVLAQELLFTIPLTIWAGRFGGLATARETRGAKMIAHLRRQKLVQITFHSFRSSLTRIGTWRLGRKPRQLAPDRDHSRNNTRPVVIGAAFLIVIGAVLYIVHGASALNAVILLHVLEGAILSVLRVACILTLALVISVFLVDRLIQMNGRIVHTVNALLRVLAVFPPNMLFPLMGAIVVSQHLMAGPWLTLMLVPGACIHMMSALFGGYAAIPPDLMRAASSLGIRGTMRWRHLTLPALSIALADGAFDAFLWCWNATIAADFVIWLDQPVHVQGLGAGLVRAAQLGDTQGGILLLFVATVIVLAAHQFLWSPLRNQLSQRYALPTSPS